MDSNDDQQGATIDLGAATVETKGSTGPYIDVVLNQPALGLSDD